MANTCAGHADLRQQVGAIAASAASNASAPTLASTAAFAASNSPISAAARTVDFGHVDARILALDGKPHFEFVVDADQVLARREARLVDQRFQRRRDRFECAEAECIGGVGELLDLQARSRSRRRPSSQSALRDAARKPVSAEPASPLP